MAQNNNYTKESTLRWRENFADRPGIYLMKLRSHLNRGKIAVEDALDAVRDMVPGDSLKKWLKP
ncbi:MAG: hypothetical protein SFY81_14385 [Verrucomicrobiota bacterium]|nr:hypothetical protein [Verrucomicrobiota bacterium]